jgi:hypothetical protein
MPQKRSATKKKKGGKRPRGKRSQVKMPWQKFFIVLFILVCGCLYLFFRYDFFQSTPGKSSPPVTLKQNLTLSLYYADPYSEKLAPEKRTIQTKKTIQETIETALREFMKGPRGDLVNTIPSGTLLNGIRIDQDRTVWVDFSSHLSESHPGGSSAEIMTVYAIVNSILLNFDEVNKVRILIEGKSVDTLAGHIDCSEPFVADKSFIK